MVGEKIETCERWVEPGELISYVERSQVKQLKQLDGEKKDRLGPAIKLRVLFEDADIGVLVKPQGLNSNSGEESMQKLLHHNLAPTTAPHGVLPWPRLVHRLDAPTGGIIVAAKTRPAVTALGEAFASRSVKKQYRSLVIGKLEGAGVVDRPVDGKESQSKWLAVMHTPSVTHGWLTTVDLWPHTGRKHQLRQHMASLGHPILGDDKYGGTDKCDKAGKNLPKMLDGTVIEDIDRSKLFLWAVKLELPMLNKDDMKTFEIEEPPMFGERRDWEARQTALPLPHAHLEPGARPGGA